MDRSGADVFSKEASAGTLNDVVVGWMLLSVLRHKDNFTFIYFYFYKLEDVVIGIL